MMYENFNFTHPILPFSIEAHTNIKLHHKSNTLLRLSTTDGHLKRPHKFIAYRHIV